MNRPLSVVDRLQAVAESGTNAILAWDRAQVLAQTDGAADGPLRGVTVAVKDNICTLDLPTTCGSKILEGYRSPYEATAVSRLRAAGAVIACKTNLDEFAMGSSTEHSAFGPCLHPTHRDRVPGGSSGGSATIVALNGVDAALGSDTGGSVRQPAAFCGVVGFKPTYGRVSRYGLAAFGSSLDQIGVLGRSVPTVGRVATAISGNDPRDSTSAGPPIGEAPAPDAGALTGVRVGIPREYYPEDLDPAVRDACERVQSLCEAAGATLVPVSLDHTDLAVATYYVIAPAEASANLARYDGVRYGARAESAGDFATMIRESRGRGLGREVRRRIVVGTYVLSAGYADAYYGRAVVTRARVASDFSRAFEQSDVLFTPTTPSPAFRLGEHARDPVAMYREDRFVVAANLAGLPAISIPIGAADNGLPIGGQLMGPAGADERVLAVAAALETVLASA